MTTGYVRQDVSNNIANGNVVDADDLDLEFNAVEAAFNSSTGHSHDGTTGEGAPILATGPAQDIVSSGTDLAPKTDSAYTLGTVSAAWSNFYTDAITLGGTAITATAAELNTLDGITSTVAELNILDGVTATAAELNALDGITATVTELNYTDGVTSNIQTQLDAKQPLDADLTAIAALANTDSNFIVGSGSAWVAESGATARASLGVTIGSQVQAWGVNLDEIAALTPTDSNFIVGNGTSWVAEGASTALASLGVTATAAELNALDGITATVSELNILDGVTSTAAELNILDGVTATAAELNYVDGVTSNVQTQLNTLSSEKAPLASPTLTGVPAAPTAAAATNTTQIATTAFVRSAVPDVLGATGSAPVFGVRAWVNFNGTGTVAIRGSGNVASITDNGTGLYTINFTTAMPDTNYAVVGTVSATGSGSSFGDAYLTLPVGGTKTTAAVQVQASFGGAARFDPEQVSVFVIR